ncbi:hypothetical protein K9L67_00690 [Candidatus Woesearchaeota archaeon]|nr:hypothetical protein [Candidatus Woesearchaeota archaeon]MCF7900724.1 hypothetical protein [Candidatus Woesearchaeota archaeon]MCF8013245.1 hypothetical protein [Candidatus Woesearchaeota archaeon]
MEDFTIERIEETRKTFIENNFYFVKKEIGNRYIEYYELPQDLNKDLPNFVCRVTNNETKKYILGVSLNIPTKIRPYFALEEYIEFIEIGMDKENRVLEAEKEVLKIIPEKIKKEYIRLKIDLFETELKLYKKYPNDYLLGEDGVKEFEKATKYLKNELKTY